MISFSIYKMGIILMSIDYIIHLNYLAYSQESLAGIISCMFEKDP